MLPKSLSIVVVGIFLMTGTIQAQQNIFFKFKDGTTSTYPVNEVRKFNFSGNVIVLQKKDGTTISWNVSTIGNYRFDATTSINNAERINNAEVKIYPNPFKGAVRIRYELPSAEKVAIDILDIHGGKLRSWPQIHKPAGIHELIWQTNENGGKAIPSGTYICRITTTKGSVSKIMIVD